MSHARRYMHETVEVAMNIDYAHIDKMAQALADLRAFRGTLYLVGMGGSAANCMHAASDLRKLCGLNVVCFLDNVAELTSRINDDGADSAMADMLRNSPVGPHDALMVLSVGGGTDTVSRCLSEAVDAAKVLGIKVMGIVGRDGGHVKRHGDCVVLVPTVVPERVTPHTEAFHMVVLHCLVSHPKLQLRATKW